MTTQLKENNFSIEANKDPVKTPKPKPERPNIDHLIKRIMIERRRDSRKNFIVFVFVLLVITGLVVLFL
tara:strand:- start:67 stop:273 length:207 start_codon:yes stop_codon:yes gene_type:complete